MSPWCHLAVQCPPGRHVEPHAAPVQVEPGGVGTHQAELEAGAAPRVPRRGQPRHQAPVGAVLRDLREQVPEPAAPVAPGCHCRAGDGHTGVRGVWPRGSPVLGPHVPLPGPPLPPFPSDAPRVCRVLTSPDQQLHPHSHLSPQSPPCPHHPSPTPGPPEWSLVCPPGSPALGPHP